MELGRYQVNNDLVGVSTSANGQFAAIFVAHFGYH